MKVLQGNLLAGIAALPPLAEPGAENIRQVCVARLVASPQPSLEYLLLLLFVLRAG